MTVPVMAVQSLESSVLKNIKRDNISTDTYAQYQNKFHSIGSRTYSDLIVPLPGETLDSHINALRSLINYGVDIIQNHNMRLLPGAETNTLETRKKFKFKTKYRLIHGDASIITFEDGHHIQAFEYEESLRSTSTMSEQDLFFLRKLHFLVDFCWNIEVYKTLLQVCLFYKINPIDILLKLLKSNNNKMNSKNYFRKINNFFTRFDTSSKEEWFDTRKEIENYFLKNKNFSKLVNNEFEKLNVLYSVVLLKDYKNYFDKCILEIIESYEKIPLEVLFPAAKYSFVSFPSLSEGSKKLTVSLPENFSELSKYTAEIFKPAGKKLNLKFETNNKRKHILSIIKQSSEKSLSKILNTQGFSLRDLKLITSNKLSFDRQFRRA